MISAHSIQIQLITCILTKCESDIVVFYLFINFFTLFESKLGINKNRN